MAGRTITQRIALDGGEQVKKDLEAIGKAAARMFDAIAGVGAANSVLGTFGTSVSGIANRLAAIQGAASRTGEAFSGFAGSVRTVIANLSLATGAVGLVVGGFVAAIKRAGEAQEKLDNTADTLGVSAEKLKALQGAAEEAGIGGDVLTKALLKMIGGMKTANQGATEYTKKLDDIKERFRSGADDYATYTRKMSDLGTNTDKTTNAFKKFGVAVSDDGGKTLRNPIAVFNDIGEALKDMPKGADRAAAAMEFFGTRSAKVVSFASKGAAGLKALTLEAERIAPALDEKGRAALDGASDSIGRVGAAATATKEQMLLAFAPSVTAIFDTLTNQVANSRKAMVDYAKQIAEKVKPIVQDLIALIEGRDGDVKSQFILDARDAVVSFGVAVKDAVTNIIVPGFKALLGILQTVADGINAVFGTKLTGGQLAIVLVVGKLLGVFGMLSSAIGLVVSGLGLLVAVFGSTAAAAVIVGAAAAAVGAAIGFLLVKVAQNLDKIPQIAKRVFAGIPILAKMAFDGVVAIVSAVFSGLGSIASMAFQGLVEIFRLVATAIIDAFMAIPSKLGAIFNGIVALAATAWGFLKSGVASLGSSVVGLFTSALGVVSELLSALPGFIAEQFAALGNAIVAFFAALPTQLAAGLSALTAAFTGAWEGIKSTASAAVDTVVGAFTSGFGLIKQAASSAWDGVRNFFDSIIQKAKAVLAAIASAVGASASSSGGGESKFARGGYVRGPGTSTSDSIRAWLSNGEFVARTSAVGKYGVAFFDALNAGRIAVDRVRALMSGVDVGGLTAVMPGRTSFATGGLALAAVGGGASKQPVNVNFGGQSFALEGDTQVVREMSLAAFRASRKSSGRKPTWYGGGK